MKILFYFGHPAQYLFLRYALKELRKRGHHISLLIKSKDVLERLLEENDEEYINILPKERRNTKLMMMLCLIKRDMLLLRYVAGRKYDLFVGTDPSLSHIGRLLNIPCITTLEDDIEVIPQLARLTFPFTTHILVPRCVKVGKYSNKKIGYTGYMKLAYLHPNWFSPIPSKEGKNYYVVRLSGLTAHHDCGIRGISNSLLDIIIETCILSGEVYITSERSLPIKYDKYLLTINPKDLHQVLAGSSILISDSQSMSMEAAMLGVPSIRISDFVGRISVLEELEFKYQLTFGFKPDQPLMIINKLKELLVEPSLREIFCNRRDIMLSEKIDVTAFLVWLIDTYPESIVMIKEKPDYEDQFRVFNH